MQNLVRPHSRLSPRNVLHFMTSSQRKCLGALPSGIIFHGSDSNSDTCMTSKKPSDPAVMVHGLHLEKQSQPQVCSGRQIRAKNDEF